MRNEMNKLLILIALVLVGFKVNAQDRDIPLEEVPEQIAAYLETHFPDISVIEASFDDHVIYKKYEISLKGRTSLEFTPDFKVKEIKSKSKLPDSVIPEKILKYVQANYPNNVITDWELDDGNQQIELDNGLDIEFSLDGLFIRVED